MSTSSERSTQGCQRAATRRNGASGGETQPRQYASVTDKSEAGVGSPGGGSPQRICVNRGLPGSTRPSEAAEAPSRRQSQGLTSDIRSSPDRAVAKDPEMDHSGTPRA